MVACNNCGAVAGNSLGQGLRASSEQAAAPGSRTIHPFRPAAIWRLRRQIAAGRTLVLDFFPGVSRTLAVARFVPPQAIACRCSAANSVELKPQRFLSPNTCVDTNAQRESNILYFNFTSFSVVSNTTETIKNATSKLTLWVQQNLANREKVAQSSEWQYGRAGKRESGHDVHQPFDS